MQMSWPPDRKNYPLLAILGLVAGTTATALLLRRSSDRKILSSAVDDTVDAILVCGGGQTQDGPPPHVAARLELAKELYDSYPADSKPKIIVSARGTPHKPGPHDERGFERPECEDNARWLVQRGVPDNDVLEESASLETIGNAYFARLMHTDVRGYRNLVIVNSEWHMPRTRDVYNFVFGLPHSLGGPAYKLKWVCSRGEGCRIAYEYRYASYNACVPD